MEDDKKTLKFQMMMSPNEAEALDNWMFKNRIRSRAEAIRRLTQIALRVEPLVDEFRRLAANIVDTEAGVANVLLSERAKAETGNVEELLHELDGATTKLTSPALEMALQTWKFKAIVDAMKSGEDIDQVLESIDAQGKKIDQTRAFVRRVFKTGD